MEAKGNFSENIEEFNKENLISHIEYINKIIEQTNTEEFKKLKSEEKNKTEEILKNKISYLSNYMSNISRKKNEEIIDFLSEIFKLSNIFFKTHGDDLIESLWKLYDKKSFHIFPTEMNQTFYEYFLHLFFLNNKNIDILLKHQIFRFNHDSKKLESNFSLPKFIEISDEFSHGIIATSEDPSKLIMHKNFLIDVLILLILIESDIRGFYTSISALLVSLESNVMLLFKSISLFGLCFWGFDKKENFVSGLLYVLGGVLRDFGKSYLKTKGILDQNLSYHKCTSKKGHEQGFFQPQILTKKECDYLEVYFMPVMREFIKTIISDLDFNSQSFIFWDDCLPIFYKLLEMEGLDQEDTFPPSVEIFHYLNLFLSDFLFFFFSNFSLFDTETHRFKSNFSYFDEFIGYSLSILWRGCRNVNNLFIYSEKKRKFLETLCDKSEYEMKDTYNHYGLCFVFYLFLAGGYSPLNVLNEKDFALDSSFLPLVINQAFYYEIYQSALYMILHTENSSDTKYYKNYQQFSICFLHKILYLLDGLEPKISGNKLYINILYEFSKFEDSNLNIKCLQEYISFLLIVN
jgi:hypothetical protein